MVQNRKSQEIVESLVNLTHDLGMDVVVEGIETRYEAEMLAGQGAESGQGFLYSQALEVAEFIAFPERGAQL